MIDMIVAALLPIYQPTHLDNKGVNPVKYPRHITRPVAITFFVNIMYGKLFTDQVAQQSTPRPPSPPPPTAIPTDFGSSENF